MYCTGMQSKATGTAILKQDPAKGSSHFETPVCCELFCVSSLVLSLVYNIMSLSNWWFLLGRDLRHKGQVRSLGARRTWFFAEQ